MEKRIHSIVIPENAGQFTDNKEKERVESYDRLNPEWTWHYASNNIYNKYSCINYYLRCKNSFRPQNGADKSISELTKEPQQNERINQILFAR